MSAIVHELEAVRAEDPHGLLRPEAVVQRASDPSNPLHASFCWDDSVAAHRHRLEQARALIRVSVTLLPGRAEPVRAYVSLTTDRASGQEGAEAGGYRPVAEVLQHDGLRKIMLEDALAELRAFQVKYARLEELASVFEAARLAQEQAGRPGRPTKKKVKASA